MSFEYVASGASFFRIDKKEAQNNPETKEKIEKAFRSIVKNDQTFSILYNGFTEKKNPEILKGFNSYRALYSDSGGLQVMTTGQVVNDVIMEKIFECQAKANYAFSFDCMPVIKSGEKSKRLDVSSRQFDKVNFQHYVEESAKNLEKQIDYFDRVGSSTKVFYIMHGNTYDDYRFWLDHSRKFIGESKFEKGVSGVALGASGLGIGKLEEIKKAFWTGQFLKEYDHIHILGIGSYPKILPYIHLFNNGYFEKNKLLSYDSTTQACCPNFGRFFPEGQGSINLTRKFSDKWIKLYEELKRLYQDDFNYDLMEFYDVCNMPCINDTHSIEKSILCHFYWAIACMRNFVHNVEAMIADTNLAYKYVDDTHNALLSTLHDIRDISDFNDWVKWGSQHTHSIAISTEKATTLEGMFV